jgi:hypothetical protein
LILQTSTATDESSIHHEWRRLDDRSKSQQRRQSRGSLAKVLALAPLVELRKKGFIDHRSRVQSEETKQGGRGEWLCASSVLGEIDRLALSERLLGGDGSLTGPVAILDGLWKGVGG